MDIIYGECIDLGGHRYILKLADRATQYVWTYGIRALSGSDVIQDLKNNLLYTGRITSKFYRYFDEKIICREDHKWLLANGSNIMAAPEGCQSHNRIVEQTWKSILEMSHSFLTERQMPRYYWYYVTTHSACMVKILPGKLSCKPKTLHELVYGVKPGT